MDLLEPALNAFWPAFRQEIGLAITRRLGVETRGADVDAELVAALFAFLMASQAPYEQVFFDCYGGEASGRRALASPMGALYAGESFAAFRRALGAHAPRPGPKLDHRYFTRPTPRIMLLEEMEALWTPIATDDDWRPFEAVLAEIADLRAAYS
jgi:uncharacterized protein YdiU (UPF0061 family)